MLDIALPVKTGSLQTTLSKILIFLAVLVTVLYTGFNRSNGLITTVDINCLDVENCLIPNLSNSGLTFPIFKNKDRNIFVSLHETVSPRSSGDLKNFLPNLYSSACNCSEISLFNTEIKDRIIINGDIMSVSDTEYLMECPLRSPYDDEKNFATLLFNRSISCPFRLSEIVSYAVFKEHFRISFNAYNNEAFFSLVQNSVNMEKSFQDMFIQGLNTFNTALSGSAFFLGFMFTKYELHHGIVERVVCNFEKLRNLLGIERNAQDFSTKPSSV